MSEIVKVFIEKFSENTNQIFTLQVVRNVYDNCTKLTATIIDNPHSVLKLTLKDMARYFNITENVESQVNLIDIALLDDLGNFVIPVEVENNSGSGPRDDEIFDTEIKKLIRYHGKLMVLITYDYNEEARFEDSEKYNWRFQFTERLEKVLDESNVPAPFLFIVGNTPRYAGHLKMYHDEDCVVIWSMWVKEQGKNGIWLETDKLNKKISKQQIKSTTIPMPIKKIIENPIENKTEAIRSILPFLEEKCLGEYKIEEDNEYNWYGIFLSKHGKGWVHAGPMSLKTIMEKLLSGLN